MTDDQYTVYTAGPVTHHSTPWGWRVLVEGHAPFEVINPLENGLSSDSDPQTMVEKCKSDIWNSDGVLVGDTGHRSPGTWREVEYALSVCEVPVVVWDIDSHGEHFVRECPVRESLDGAVETLQELMDDD